MLIRILGPLEVVDADAVPTVAGARLRRLLVRLAWDASRIVSAGELIEAVWLDDETPSDVANSLQSLVSRLRRALGSAAVITQSDRGYRLAVDRDDVDAHAFATAAREGHAAMLAGRNADAVDILSTALAHWRGIALQDADSAPYAATARRRLEESRLDALADRNDAQLALGGADGLVAELEALTTAHPLRERFTGQLMTALAATGRSAEALAAYEHLRRFLADELGTDPSPAVQSVHLAVLRGEVPDAETPATDDTKAVPAQTNLRSSISSFVGRGEDLDRVDDLLTRGRLTTLVGPGGAGKTRLANEAAARWVGRVESGVWFVELAPVTEPDGIPQAILNALGIRVLRALDRPLDRQDADDTRRLFTALADADALLVIDNCEHLIAATAQLLDDLLARCPRVRVLTTSREPLNIAGESLCAVPPLRLPAVDATPEQASTSASVQLFTERAASANAGFRVDETTVEAVVEIVRRLDGLPLAIELAAARLRVLPVWEIAARLDDRFRLLTGGSRTAMPRHRTLRAVVEWSWDLLDDDERTLARRLAVFPAGATVDGARAVCDEIADIDAVLDSLVDKSLLQVPIVAAHGRDDDAAAGSVTVRYRMLETIREFGIERLEEADELASTRAAHARYFAALVADLEPALRTNRQLQALRRIGADHENILAALRSLGESGAVDAALAMTVDLGWYWTILGAHSEAATWLGWALVISDGTDSWLRRLIKGMAAIELVQTAEVQVMGWASLQEDLRAAAADLDVIGTGLTDGASSLVVSIGAMLAFFTGENELGNRILAQALDQPDPWWRAAARIMRMGMDENLGDVDRMRTDAAAAVAEFTAIGDHWGRSSALALRARLRTLDGDDLGAIDDINAAMDLSAEVGSAEDTAMLNVRLADLYARIGDMDAAMLAVDAVRTSVAESFLAGDRGLIADVTTATIAAAAGDMAKARSLRAAMRSRVTSLGGLGPMAGHLTALALASSAWIFLLDGESGSAADDLTVAMQAAIGTWDQPLVANVGVVVAALAQRTGDPLEAARKLGAAARLRGSPDWGDLWVRDLAATLRQQLGAEAFEAAYGAGAAMDRDAAISALTPSAADAAADGVAPARG